MLGQCRIGMGADQRAEFIETLRPQPGRATRAGPVGQRLTAAVAGQPAIDRAHTDAKVGCRFTRCQPRVKGVHQALTEVGRGASGHAPIMPYCHNFRTAL